MSQHDYPPELYGPHLEAYPETVTTARRGSRSGPEGGARRAVKQVPMDDAPVQHTSVSRAGKARKDTSGAALRLDGYS